MTPSRVLVFTTLLLGTLVQPAAAQDGSSQMGHARARRNAELGRLPEPGEVVVDHLVNYHRHDIPLPKAGEDVAVDLRWDVGRGLGAGAVLQIGIATPRVHDLRHLRPVNLALVIDSSGSMADRDKMSRVKRSLARFVENLRPTDRLAIVTYSNQARLVLRSREVGDGRAVLDEIERLEPGGNTNLHAGLMAGYDEVSRCYDERATNRVVLLTDGIANCGVTEPERIAMDSRRFNREGIDLSTIGVGMDFNRELLATLAKDGRGLFHFVADEEDTAKVFDQELQSLLGAVARSVRLTVRHDRGVEVARIFGYEPRRDASGFEIDFEDLNHGLTNVVLVELRNSRFARYDDLGPIDVELSYERPDRPGHRVVVTRSAKLVDSSAVRSAPDHEVEKNYTIAVMAQAIRDMAEAAKHGRIGEAERCVRDALEFARLRYPSNDDEDLLRVRRMLEQYQATLSARIERFRDH